MNEFPFGFGKSEDPDDGSDRPDDASAGGDSASGGAGGFPGFPGLPGFGGPPGLGGEDLGAALHRFADLLSWQGGPVNWDMAKNVARQAAAGDDPSVTAGEKAAVADAVRLADLWLDAASAFPSGITTTAAWSRAEWIDATKPTWAELVEPVAARVVDAFGGNLGASVPEEMRQMAGPMLSMVRQLGGVMFGGQVGQALGSLAKEVVGSTDVGFPLGKPGQAALLPAGVRAFGAGIGVADDEVRLYLALREAAHHRLFVHTPWLRGRVIAAVEDYARGITVDGSRLEEMLGSLDPSNPEAIQEALTGGLFEPENTPQQQTALRRLETLLALIEGWVDDAVSVAVEGRLEAAPALAETVRRRRASGGPAEQMFGALVGLELRPRRLREAAAMWRAVREAGGVEARERLWSHPDLLPSASDLDDPAAIVARATGKGEGPFPDDISALLEQTPEAPGGEGQGKKEGPHEGTSGEGPDDERGGPRQA